MVAEDNPYATKQESFWAGSFGNEYAKRNAGEALVTSNIILFSRILASTANVQSIIELGCNTGLCLEALKRVDTRLDLTGFEINKGNPPDFRGDLEVELTRPGVFAFVVSISRRV